MEKGSKCRIWAQGVCLWSSLARCVTPLGTWNQRAQAGDVWNKDLPNTPGFGNDPSCRRQGIRREGCPRPCCPQAVNSLPALPQPFSRPILGVSWWPQEVGAGGEQWDWGAESLSYTQAQRKGREERRMLLTADISYNKEFDPRYQLEKSNKEHFLFHLLSCLPLRGTCRKWK